MIALLLRDLRLATRAGGGFGLGLVFFLILVTLVPFGVGPDSARLATIAPGILWVGALLAALLSLDRIFALDHEDGTLDQLATAPLPLALCAPLLGILLNLPGAAMLPLLLSLLAGTPALSVIGAFGAGLTVGLKRGGLLLSLLVLPLYVPTLIFGAEVARRGAEGAAFATPLAFLAAITLASLAGLPYAAAAAIRINLR